MDMDMSLHIYGLEKVNICNQIPFYFWHLLKFYRSLTFISPQIIILTSSDQAG